MNPIQELIEGYLAAMRAIPALVTLMGGADRMIAHHLYKPLDSDIFQVIKQLDSPRAMLYYGGSGVVTRGNSRELYGHQINLALMLDSELDIFAFIWAFENDVPTGYQSQIRRLQVSPQFYPMNPYSVVRSSFGGTPDTDISYPEMQFTVTQKV